MNINSNTVQVDHLNYQEKSNENKNNNEKDSNENFDQSYYAYGTAKSYKNSNSKSFLIIF